MCSPHGDNNAKWLIRAVNDAINVDVHDESGSAVVESTGNDQHNANKNISIITRKKDL